MLINLEYVPATDTSFPFAPASDVCGFSECGYMEDEYFMHGSANVYSENDKGLEVIYKDAPYTTRILIRRPEAIEKFSGNVIIEILNATAMMDIDRMWVNSWKYFTRNGDIYVGITSKGHVVDSLLKFDKERYQSICWNNPLPDRQIPDALASGPFPFLPQYESGLFWDMLTDLAKLLRMKSDFNPIAKYGVNYLYLTGWSQSGSYLVRYLKSFSYLPENCKEHPLFDGYLAAGCGADIAPMNAYEPIKSDFFRAKGIPKGSVMGAKEPYININTESENRHTNWYGDFDQPDYKFRSYPIPGSSHDSYYNLIEYYNKQKGKERLVRFTFDGVDGEPLNYPYEFIFNAAFRNLYAWVRYGVSAPHAEKIKTEVVDREHAEPLGAYIRNCTDAFGNAIGGIRTPAIDYPVGRYESFSKTKDGRINPMFGKVNPFPPEVLKGIYGDIDNYRRLVSKRTDEIIAEGFILAEDREECIEEVVKLAKMRGL